MKNVEVIFKRRYILGGLFFLTFQIAKAEDLIKQNFEKSKKDEKDFVQNGIALKNAINMQYAELRAASNKVIRHIDVSNIVAKYIPIGTSFEIAEKILMTAEYKVSPRPIQNTMNLMDKASLLAHHTFYKDSISETFVQILLNPEIPEKISDNKVKSIYAKFLNSKG